ncbi:MarR family winged helix-turn-helix transcriptional regulator [Ahrensia sp. 13_GOM-1096m]|uniref:MarR family winged helix-turn-helix transcriptional regulator n=1 Tax=Ahrensia sp. 13_GOM-1096m TaxID=1380380 RepID=UPI000B2EBE94|nr:MarR family transcriptional regulator [Ahrensia sp. 13_GOM-1096m]
MSMSSAETAYAMSTKTKLRLWLRLLKVTRSVENDIREKLRVEFDSTLPRFDVLAALYQFPKGLRMSELSGLLKVSNGNVTGIVDRLVKDGLIIRTPVPGDRRALRVRLTKRGEEEFALQAAAHEQWIDDLLSDVSMKEAENMISSFDRILVEMHGTKSEEA